MQFLVDKRWGQLECAHLINEGGLGLKDAILDGQTMYPISVGEKGTLWLRMYANGPSGVREAATCVENAWVLVACAHVLVHLRRTVPVSLLPIHVLGTDIGI